MINYATIFNCFRCPTVGGKECKITLCDVQTGSSTHTLSSHRLPVMSLAWSPKDEYLLASGSHDNRVILWDIRKATGPLVDLDQHNGSAKGNVASMVTAHNGHVNGLCFSSDGLHLLSFGTDNRLRLWDAFSGRNALVSATEGLCCSYCRSLGVVNLRINVHAPMYSK